MSRRAGRYFGYLSLLAAFVCAGGCGKSAGPLSITTTSLPGGNYGTAYSATITASGGVAPFSWSISSGSLTPGLSLVSSSARSVTISGTPTAQSNSNFTIKVIDSKSGSATQVLTIAIGSPLPLAVATATLPGAAINVAYSGATLQASSGVPPYSWSIASGSLPPGLTLSLSGTISGTPTQAGTFVFTVKVTDSENPAASATKPLSIGVGNPAVLSGNYAFEFNGYNSKANLVSVAGSFTADGKGNLTNGVEDLNAIGGSPVNQTFTGAYTISGNNQGLLTFSSLPGSPAYSFSVNATGSHGRMVEFDSSGTRGSGDLELRTLSACTSATFSGHYAFGVSGQQMAVAGVSIAGPDVIIGSFSASPAVAPSTKGSVSLGELDADTPVKLTTKDQTLNGTYQPTSQPTRCSMTLLSSLQSSIDFSVYPISASQSFIVETDTVSPTAPMLTAGTLQQQVGAPYTLNSGSTFTSSSVAAFRGSEPAANGPFADVALVSIVGTGASGFSISVNENLAGTVASTSMQSTFIQADPFGRVATSPTTPFDPVFYVINQNTAYCLGTHLNPAGQTYPLFGIFEPQSAGPFTASTIAFVFTEGTIAPTTALAENTVGIAIFANAIGASGDFSAVQDESTPQANTPGVALAATYSISDANAGTGTLTLTQPSTATAAFIIVSPNQVLTMTTTAGDTNPIVQIFEQ